jgi:DNA-binding NarL/FixJ family response regulator
MSDNLDVIIVDDEIDVCNVLSKMIKKFYTWGNVITYTDADEAISHCLDYDIGVGIFIIDVFLGGKTGFIFLDAIEEKFPAAHEDAIIITGNASDVIVNLCIASDVNYLLEKPVSPHELQLAIRSIVTKYMIFAKRLMENPEFADDVAKF